jgi:hypothetical protein
MKTTKDRQEEGRRTREERGKEEKRKEGGDKAAVWISDEYRKGEAARVNKTSLVSIRQGGEEHEGRRGECLPTMKIPITARR